MKTETHFAPEMSAAVSAPARLAALVTALVVVALLATFWPTARSIEAIWRRSETFAHGYVIVPIVLWLVWTKRGALSRIAPQPFWPALGVMVVAAVGWMAGRLAGILGLEQFALLVMIEAAIVAVLGLAIARELIFPLAFLFFAIPAGEMFVPWLIDRTADFTVAAVKTSGVPVYREGNHFSIPSGSWSIVEACSGVRYLIASMMVGTLYAYLSYRSRTRRALFVLASILVPIVANWLRAYTIVMIGHLSNNKLAVGIDHIIYGWVFFGLVMLIMFWIGSLWREDKTAPVPRRSGLLLHEGAPLMVKPIALALCAVVVVSVSSRVLEIAVERHSNSPVAPLAQVEAAGGWVPVEAPQPRWAPHFMGARTERHQWFSKHGRVVGVYLALYAQQSQGQELVSSQNQLVLPGDNFWVERSRGHRRVDWAGREFGARTAEVSGGGAQFAVRAWYWVNGTMTSSDVMAKVLLALQKILLKPDHSAVIVIYTPEEVERPVRTGDVLDDFSRDMAVPVMRALLRATEGER